MKAVVIGPGRIGCGFAGQLLRASGWDVTFVGTSPVINVLSRQRRYVVRLVEANRRTDLDVQGFDAVSISDARATADAIADADLVATAVGGASLAAIAPCIAAGLARRSAPANVIAFENLLGAGAHLRHHVGRHLPQGSPLDRHGFSGAVVSRVVSERRWPKGPYEPLAFVGNSHSTFSVEGPALRHPLPEVTGMVATDDFAVAVRRKLYTYSAGHAACAYLGYLKGYHYIHTAIRDPEIRAAVEAAMTEGQRGLAARYGAALAGSYADLQAIIDGFANAGLADPIARVARDPRRKLAHEDRLVGAACLAAASGAAPEGLALTVAAALVFCDPDDRSCRTLHREVEQRGMADVLSSVCGLVSDDGVGKLVADEFRVLTSGWAEGNLLLSIDRHLWAWEAPAGGGAAAVPV